MSGSQDPRLRVAPRASRTFGDLASDLAGDYGLIPDPWQQLVINDWLSERQARWTSMTCGLSVPRQNGKNGALEVRELFGMVGLGEKILHTAHEVKTAQKHFRRLKHFFGERKDDPGAKFPELNALVREVRNVNGQEGIYLTNGGSVEIVARSKGSGRGFTVDVLVFDEAQELGDDALEALKPTISAAPLGNPQTIYTGTPPGPNVNGEVFTRIRAEGLSSPGRRCWHEWSCEGAVDLDSPEEWARSNPALGGRLHVEVIEAERGEFSDDGFARERLGMWAGSLSRSVIDAETWGHLADEQSLAVEGLALGIDVAHDRAVASVSLAGLRADGTWHVELDEQRNGVGWLASYIEVRCQRNDIRAVVINGNSPEAGLVDELKRRKITVTATGARDVTSACASFYDGAVEGWLHHIDQPQLNLAVSSARKRPVGDAWAWNRKNSTSDITPLVACTLALWGAQSSTVKKPVRKPRTTQRRAVVM